MRYLETSIYNYLQKTGIPVAKKYITNSITQHPDYPALTAATDVLDTLGIQYNAVIADKNNVNELSFPLLAHTTANGGGLQFIHKKEAFTTTIKENWDGVVLMLTSTTITNNKENKTAFAKEQKQKKQFTIIVIGLLLLVLFPFLYHITSYGIVPLLLIVLSIIGIGLGVLIYQQEQGIDNSITDTLCKKTEDCSAVVNSKAATLFWGIKWSDIGIIYFTAVTLLLSITAYTIGLQLWLYIFSVSATLSLPFTLYSIYYQKQKAKKWCVLCLYTLVVLWLQFALLAYHYFTINIIDSFSLIKMAIVFMVLLSSIAALWLIVIKPMLQEQLSTLSKVNNLHRFKNSPPIFVSELLKQEAVHIPVQQNDLQLGNPLAPLQLVVACNPHCGPCVDAHFLLEEMLHYTKEQLGLTIHFMANHTPNESIRSKAINTIYNAIEANDAINNPTTIETILHYWFSTNDIEKFTALIQQNGLPITNTEISNLQKSDTASWDKHIEFTPTLLINGYKLPKPYSINDFIKIVVPLINEEELVNKLNKTIIV